MPESQNPAICKCLTEGMEQSQATGKEDPPFGVEQGTEKQPEPRGHLNDCGSSSGEQSDQAEMDERPRTFGSVAFS